MDKGKIAKELAQIGAREARLMAKLRNLQERRCELLQCVAASDEAGLEPEIVALTVAPKDDD